MNVSKKFNKVLSKKKIIPITSSWVIKLNFSKINFFEGRRPVNSTWNDSYVTLSDDGKYRHNTLRGQI